MPKKKEKYRVAKMDEAALVAASSQAGVGGLQGMMLPACLDWLDQKLAKKEKASRRLSTIAGHLENYAYPAIQHRLNQTGDYRGKVVTYCIELGKNASPLSGLTPTQGASAGLGPHELLSLTNGREKQAIVVAINFEAPAAPPQLSSSAPPRYSLAIAEGATAAELPSYSATTGFPTFFAMYRSQGKKARGFTFPHIYLFELSLGEFKCSVKEAHHMFEALLTHWGGSQQVSSISAWIITPGQDSWAFYDDDDDDDSDEERYAVFPGR